MSTVQARLLGGASLSLRGEWTTPPATQASALLFYLAHQQRWVTRDELTYLFWPDRDERKARSSLRFLLHGLKRQAPVEGLEIEAARLRWLVDTDLRSFLDREADVGSRFEQYGGPLLDGFRLRGATEFESWLDIERQRVHEEFVSLVDRLSESLATSGRVDEALDVLDSVLSTDPLAERTLTHKLRLLVDHGRRGEAEAAYRDFAHRLRQEFGLEPDEATQRLVSRTGTALAVTRTASRRAHTVPVAIDPLVGRHREKGEVKALLTDPACRLLTLLAAGGMGKSRLALEVGRELQSTFEHGARLVPLADAIGRDDLVAELIRSLGVPLYGPSTPLTQLLHSLRDRTLLLVLDNLEVVTGAASVIETLLEGAPGVRIVATSRSLLGVVGEWVYEVDGLTLPGAAEAELPSTAASAREHGLGRVDGQPSDAGELSEAEELFVLRARQLVRGFAVSPANRSDIARIVSTVGGMPLAIELAAAWLRVLGLSELASEMGTGLNIVAPDTASVDVRHRGIIDVLSRSWELLPEVDQGAMRRLSVFPAGFTTQSAWEVAEVAPPTLLSLVNRSFLLRMPSNRFARHPLIAAYSLERAAEYTAERQRLASSHAHYFLDWAEGLLTDLTSERQPHAIELMEQVEADLKAAWCWAVEHEPELVGQARKSLRTYLTVTRRWSVLNELIAALDDAAEPGTVARVWARLEQARSIHAPSGGLDGAESQRAESLALEAHTAALELNAWAEAAEAANTMGSCKLRNGQYQEGIAYYLEAAKLARTLDDRFYLAGINNNLGIAYTCLGRYAEAASALAESCTLYTEEGSVFEYGNTLHNLVHLEIVFGRFESALRRGEEMLAIERRNRHPMFLIERLHNLTRARLAVGQLDAAGEHAREGLEIVDRLDEGARGIGGSLKNLLGQVAFLAGDLVTARNLFELVDSPMLTGVALAEERLDEAESLALRHLPESIGEDVLASSMHARLQTWRAEVALRRGDQFAARQLLVASLQAALLVPLPPAVCFTLPTWAEYLVLAGDGRSASARHATRAAGLALVHPSSTHETKQRAETVMRRHPLLREGPPPPQDMPPDTLRALAADLLVQA